MNGTRSNVLRKNEAPERIKGEVEMKQYIVEQFNFLQVVYNSAQIFCPFIWTEALD